MPRHALVQGMDLQPWHSPAGPETPETPETPAPGQYL